MRVHCLPAVTSRRRGNTVAIRTSCQAIREHGLAMRTEATMAVEDRVDFAD